MIPAKKEQPAPSTIEDVLVKGDLSKLTEQQRVEYYTRVCQSIGLNPLTRPFDYIMLNNKLTLYAKRDAADQLRKLHGISIEIISQDKSDGLLTIHVRAKDRDGRQDEDLGVVAFGDNLKGEAAANTILKAVTKAKRRVTLSISGLGFLDETEVADIPAASRQEPKPDIIEPRHIEPPSDPETGEVTPHEIRLSDPPDWISFGQSIIAACNGGKPEEIDNWLTLNAGGLMRMLKDAPKVHRRMMDAVNKIRP